MAEELVAAETPLAGKAGRIGEGWPVTREHAQLSAEDNYYLVAHCEESEGIQQQRALVQ